MTFNATFSNISGILIRSVLLMEETGVPGENHRPVASHWKTLSHIRTPRNVYVIQTRNFSGDMRWFHHTITTTTAPWKLDELLNSGSCKSNYHVITTMTFEKYLCTGFHTNIMSLLQTYFKMLYSCDASFQVFGLSILCQWMIVVKCQVDIFFIYITTRTSYISMRWWWYLSCTSPTCLVFFL
jgi:hypothetical protein